MADSRPPGDPGVTGGSLFRVNRGELLGMLPRGTAERGYRLYQERQVVRIVWNGDRIEAELSQPSCTVHVPEHAEGQSLIASCTQCGDDTACPHAAAALAMRRPISPYCSIASSRREKSSRRSARPAARI